MNTESLWDNMKADPVPQYNNEYDDKCQKAEALAKNARKISDAILDALNRADIEESVEYLSETDLQRLSQAYADGDELEIGRLHLKGAYAYADTLGEIKAEKKNG